MIPKFKAVTTDGKWVDGYLARENTIHSLNNENGFGWSGHEVIPETVCVGVEYGGKWYYSGDQFSISPGYMSTLEFKDGCMFSVYKHPEDGEEIPLFDMGSISMKMAQYIGNIHDHLIR